MNANQVFKWRRAFERGELIEPCSALLPVTVPSPSEPESDCRQKQHRCRRRAAGSIHIEFPGRAMISVESGADRRSVASDS